MFVALLRLELRLPDATSLKDKRSVLRSLSADLRKLNCAVAEVDHQDQRQRATVAVATVWLLAVAVATSLSGSIRAAPSLAVLQRD